jgi:hypothetical protein
MAVEESIKIKIQANAEEFKIVAGIINTELGKLGKNFEILEGNIKQTSNAMKGFDNSSKKFNKGIMSISLILQDLPYGFRGIQNNIPALAQGFGVLYLAISAVTAAMTYFVMQGDNMSKDTKKIYETFKEFINGVVNQVYNTLRPAFDSIVKSIMFLWDMFGNNLINSFKHTWDNLLAFTKIAFDILANAFTLVVSVIKGDWSKFGESLLNIFKYTWNAIVQFLSFSLKMIGNTIGAFTRIFNKDLGDSITKSTEYTANKFSDSFKFAFKEVEKEYKKFDVFSLFGGKKKAKDTNKTYDADTSNLELLKSQQKYYKDDLAIFYEYGRLIIKEEERLALEKANFEKKSAEEIKNIKAKSQADIIVNQQEFGRALMAIADKNTKDYEKNEEEIAKIILNNREQISDGIKAINKKINNEEIKSNNTRLNATLKATRGNYQAQKTAIEEAIVRNEQYKESAIDAGAGTEEFDAAAKDLKAQLEGLVDPVEEFNNSLSVLLSGTFADLIAGFGEGFATMFNGGGIKEVMNNFLGILADGLIQVGKLAIATGLAIEGIKTALKTLNPVVAIAAGIALIALGSFVKSRLSNSADSMGGTKKFANGGIISGPTMGLMGEYPGASHNPEVVAPLNKLKSLIGNSGGGTLEARISGNDLLILMNKAGRNNNNTF